MTGARITRVCGISIVGFGIALTAASGALASELRAAFASECFPGPRGIPVCYETTGISYTDDPGQASVVTVGNDGPSARPLRLRDPGSVVQLQDGAAEFCTSESDEGTCSVQGRLALRLLLGDGADTTALTVASTVDGGDGDDHINGSDDETSWDYLFGGNGADVIAGGLGSDLIGGGLGGDTIRGGGGDDQVVYSLRELEGAERTAGVNVDLDGEADDGAPGEGDNVLPDVEDITGTPFSDVLVGNDEGQTIDGDPSALDDSGSPDEILGAGGDDYLTASAGTIDGGAGDDQIGAKGGTVTGGPGDDEVYTAAIADGGEGADHIRTLEDGSVLRGGPGDDLLEIDTALGLQPQTGEVEGGSGRDRIVFTSLVCCSAGLQLTLDDVANDGTRPDGKMQIATDIEDVSGSGLADRIVGSAADNRLVGGRGGDRITGSGGEDVLVGGAGSDLLFARDGERDAVRCGPGSDRLIGDSDDVVKGCERVRRSVGGKTATVSLLEQARLNTRKRAGTECDRHTPPCRSSGVEACWKPRPRRVACRAFARRMYGPEPSDDVTWRARFVWGYEDGRVTLLKQTRWR